jgi:hypothetical protein
LVLAIGLFLVLGLVLRPVLGMVLKKFLKNVSIGGLGPNITYNSKTATGIACFLPVLGSCLIL